MIWRRTGDKPLSEPIMAYITDAYVSVSQPGIQVSDVPSRFNDYTIILTCYLWSQGTENITRRRNTQI